MRQLDDLGVICKCSGVRRVAPEEWIGRDWSRPGHWQLVEHRPGNGGVTLGALPAITRDNLLDAPERSARTNGPKEGGERGLKQCACQHFGAGEENGPTDTHYFCNDCVAATQTWLRYSTDL